MAESRHRGGGEGARTGGERAGNGGAPFEPGTGGSAAGAAWPTVPRLWPESTIVCIGGGPSLTREDVAHCEGRARVIVINDAHRLAPWADVLYAADAKWWNYYQGVPSFVGPKYSLQRDATRWGVEVLHNTGQRGLELDPAGLRTGQNSGYQAINLAVHLGARRILLLGYDMHAESEARSHWFGAHPERIRSSVPFALYLALFPTILQPLAQLGVTVVNCSRETALTIFPRQTIQEALP